MSNNALKSHQEILLTHIDSSLEDLGVTAKSIFDLLNEYSDRIKKLEHSLREKCAFFTFRSLIKEETSQYMKKPVGRHDVFRGVPTGYYTKTKWYFSWEKDEAAKSEAFRLFLIGEEVEIVLVDFSDEGPSQHELSAECIFRRVFSETNLDTRLQYAQYIGLFMDAFKRYLEQFKQQKIKNSKLPTDAEWLFIDDEESPF